MSAVAADSPQTADSVNHVDVLIVGAGLSGIGAARHLQDKLPNKSFLIVEMRDALGGTWDIFRYPGVRSDSDMYTLGYKFKPWTNAKSIADGPSILEYLQETASETGVDQHIRYGKKVVAADFSTADARWTVTLEDAKSGERSEVTCNFLYGNTGYYRYDHGYEPDFPGIENFNGEVIKPQFWPEDLDYEGKRVVIIGSGATAVTILPAMADKAEMVTMLQRTPTYLMTLPEKDPIAHLLYRALGEERGYTATRWKNATQTLVFYHFCQRFPDVSRKLLMGGIRRQTKGAAIDVDTDFNPPYSPWDQRLCVVPSGDLFRSLRKGTSEIVTDHIETFTEDGITLKSGKHLPADIVITATGLDLLPLGGIEVSIDGVVGDAADTLVYRGCMLSDVPNFAFTVGYTNASWTLKADLVAEYTCRVLKHMDEHGYDTFIPHNDDPNLKTEPLLDFPAGYVLRAIEKFPKAGSKAPWKLRMTYHQDFFDFNRAELDDGKLKFAHAAGDAPTAEQTEAVAV
ncbi:MAG: NAD(P)/FAD-dependent oxidoreductase [Thermoleophilaceae bacterium]|nr:NAD(P)/FAD-dependent oxidoreductase [Thermoleophilaceae bacterium]